MPTDNIIRYDAAFISKFEKLYDMIEAGDRAALYRWMIDNFGFIFTCFQYYARLDAAGGVPEFAAADDATRRELMRPLSYRQFRMVERSFSRWEEEKDLAISSIWDFLHDNGRIYEKYVMSTAEVAACSLILQQVYVHLS